MSETSGAIAKDQFAIEYAAILERYLSSGKEADLSKAYELGVKAAMSGKLLHEMLEMHKETVAGVVVAESNSTHIGEVLRRESAFLTRFLMRFETAYQALTKAGGNLKVEIAERKHTEDELKKNERYFRPLIENSLDMINILDSDGVIRYSSPSCKKVVGYRQDELAGRNFFEFLNHNDVNTALEIFDSAKRSVEQFTTVELRYRHKNGSWVTLESMGKSLIDDPEISGYVLSSRDITDRRNLEELRRRYEFIANASGELMMLVNRDYYYEAANEALCTALNRKRHDVIGKSVADIFGRETFEEILKPSIDLAFAGSGQCKQSWLDVPELGRRFFEVSFYPYRDLMGVVTHIAVIKRDITDRRHDEDEVKKSHMRLTEAQSVAHVGSWEINASMDFLLCSEEMMNILGRRFEESMLSYQQFIMQVPLEDREKVDCMFRSSLAKGESFDISHRISLTDGVIRIVRTRGKIVEEGNGESVKMIGTTQDLTEQELTQEALTSYEIRYRRLFETSKDGVLLIDAGTRKITDVNPFLIDLLGYDKKYFIGKSIDEIDAVKGISKSEGIFSNVLEKEHVLADDIVLRSKGGQQVHLEFVSISYMVNGGKVVQCHFWNITEQKRLEEALQDSEDRFRALIENAIDIIAIVEKDGKFKYVSPSVESVLGYKPSELVHNNILNLVNAEDSKEIRDILTSVADEANGPKGSFEFSFMAQDGSWRIIAATVANLLRIPLVSGILVNASDVTEKRLLLNKLESAARHREEDMRKYAMSLQQAQEDERKRIAMELHDDICQRLTAMRLNLTVLQDDVQSRKKLLEKRWQAIKKEIDNVATEVRRISSNLRPSALDHFGLVTALRLICSEMERVHGLRTEFQTSASLKQHYNPQTEIAVFRIAQEALTNCVKHSGVKSAEIRLEQNGKILEFSVSDQGKGFDESDYIRMMEGEKHMGLMNMRERARLLGGGCRIQSSPGGGTNIFVRIPIVEDEIEQN